MKRKAPRTRSALTKPRAKAGSNVGFHSRGQSGYAGGSMSASPVFFHWHPALREANDDVRAAWRMATARTVNSIQNSGWLAGCIEQSVASVVGDGLQLGAKPNAQALGWEQSFANQWAREVETRFSMWAEHPRACDAGARFSFGQMQCQAYRHYMATGEILATLPWIERQGTMFKTKVKLLPAWRMSLRTEMPNLFNGVRVDATGAPVGYVLNRIPYPMYDNIEDVEVPATDVMGRPLVVHVFDGDPDQVRGISPFTPILKVTRQFDQLADATLTAAIIQAVFAAMFKSAAPTDDVIEAMQTTGEQKAFERLIVEKAEWYRQTDINLGNAGKILHGFPGDELQFFRSEHPNQTYEPFAKFLLRECSRAAAMTYEEFTGDYAGATFSSVKMGTATNWPRVVYRRKNIVAPFAQKCYEAWLEEDIEAGRTPFPGGVQAYLANKEAAAQSVWRGPTMPQADELKSAMAAQTLQEIGVPDSVVFAPYGGDVDDWYEQRKREQDRRAELGIADPVLKAQPNPRSADRTAVQQQGGAPNG